MEITAELVKTLRDKTNCGFKDCKKALKETPGDLEAAVTYLRQKGIAVATKRAKRATSEGTVWSLLDAIGTTGVLLEVNCESDFVAKTEAFQEFGARLAAQVAQTAPADLEVLLSQPWQGQPSLTVAWYLHEIIGQIGENIRVRRLLAGLESIGKNNLVITPKYGPRISWRVPLLDHAAKATGPVEYRPCDGCHAPCCKACLVGAFDETVYDASALGQSQLPGSNGTYDRITCNTKMAQDVEDAAGALATREEDRKGLASTMNALEEPVIALPLSGSEAWYGVKYCGRCELSCPVGAGITARG